MTQVALVKPANAVAPYRQADDTAKLVGHETVPPKLLDLQIAAQVGIREDGTVANLLEHCARHDALTVEKLAEAKALDTRGVNRWLSGVVDDMQTLMSGEPTFDRATRFVSLYRRAVIADCQTIPGQTDIMARVKEAYLSQCEIKAITDAPYLCADGLMRTNVSVPIPSVLGELRKRQGLQPHMCELVVIGAGQGGIACAAAAAVRGVDVVVFEKNYTAAAFSQGGAPSVKLMRSGLGGSTMARDGVSPPLIVKEGKIAPFLKAESPDAPKAQFLQPYDLRTVAASARLQANDPARSDPRLRLPEPLEPGTEPHPGVVARAEFFGYANEMAKAATALPGAFIVEQALDTAIAWDPADGRFTVTTSDGHAISAKYVAIAAGMAGSLGQNARSLPELDAYAVEHRGKLIVVHNTDELSRAAPALAAASDSQLVIPDGLLGQAYVEAHFATLKTGTSVAIIGSGEGAAKAAVEVALAYPHLVVNLFTQGPLLPCQPDTPNFNFKPDPVVQVQVNAELGARSLALVDQHPTTVTPEAMLLLVDLAEQGRVKIFELGAKFGDESVELSPSLEGSGMTVRVKEDAASVKNALSGQRDEFAAVGIKVSDPTTLVAGVTITGPIIVGLGFDREKRLQNPLIRSLVNQGLLQLGDDGTEFLLDPVNNLSSRTHGRVIPVGSVNRTGFSSSTISGCAVTAGRAIDYILYGGRESTQFAELRDAPNPPIPGDQVVIPANNTFTSPAARFLGVNPTLHAIAGKDPTARTPAEQLVLSRADAFQEQAVRVGTQSGLAPR